MTKKPCPACKEVDVHRKADDICFECRQKLDGLPKQQSLWEESIKKSSFDTLIRIAKQAHWNEYIPTPCRTSDISGKLQELFWDLVMSASVEVGTLFDNEMRVNAILVLGKPTEDSDYRLMNKQVAEAIVQLRLFMRPLMEEIYKNAQENASEIIQKFKSIKNIVS